MDDSLARCSECNGLMKNDQAVYYLSDAVAEIDIEDQFFQFPKPLFGQTRILCSKKCIKSALVDFGQWKKRAEKT